MDSTSEQSLLIVQARDAGPQSPSYSGTIVNVAEDRLTLLFPKPIGFAPRQLVTIGYKDPGTGRFLRAQGCIIAAFTNSIRPIYEIALTSSFLHNERRQSYRVPAVAADIMFSIGADPPCGIIDVSQHGLAVTSTTAFSVGAVVPIAGHFERTHCTGHARICSILPLTKGRLRLGLEIPPDEKNCLQWLHELSNTLQRRQLRRRVGTATRSERVPRSEARPNENAHQIGETQYNLPPELQYLTVRIPVSYLLDHPLPGTLNDPDDALIAKAGRKLSCEEIMALVETPIILGRDWWFRERKAAPKSTIQHKAVAPSPYDELRAFQRTQWETVAVVKLLEEHDSREFEVTTCDLSQGGLSFFSKSFIHVGTRLAIEVDVGQTAYRTRGRVASCEYEPDGGGYHRIGVQFTRAVLESDEDFGEPERHVG